MDPTLATGAQTEEQKAVQDISTTDAQKQQAAQVQQNQASPEVSFATYNRGFQADKAEPLVGVQHNLSGFQVLQAQQEYAARIEAEKEAQISKDPGPFDKLLTSTKE